MFLFLILLLLIGIIGFIFTYFHDVKSEIKYENEHQWWERKYYQTDSHCFHCLFAIMFTAFVLMGGLGILAVFAGTL